MDLTPIGIWLKNSW